MTGTSKNYEPVNFNTEKPLPKKMRPFTAMNETMRQRSRRDNAALNTVQSQRRLSPESKFLSITSQENSMNKHEKLVQRKLAYEWKNIYRNLVSSDTEDSGCITLKEFDDVCLKFKVSFNKQELGWIRKMFADELAETGRQDLINYRRLSYTLGLHKDSLNYISGRLQSSNVKKLSNMRERMFNSIEPPKRTPSNDPTAFVPEVQMSK